LRAAGFILTALWLLRFAAAAGPVEVRLEDGRFRVHGWTPGAPPAAGWESLLSVYAGHGDVPPMLGSYAVDDGALTFRPRFPLAPGVAARAVFRLPGAAPIEARFTTPKPDAGGTTRVLQVYPTVDVIPENQLKFYLHFSAPMSRGEGWSRIHLLDEKGAKVDLPFLELDQELWDPDYRRFTVLFDPGRIKRGLLPLEEVGPSIVEGKSYTLAIDREWLDASGAPLREGYRKSFRVGPPDRSPPDQRKWRVAAPKAGTSDPLAIGFGEPMDWALAQRLIEVAGVAGSVEIARNETEWRFTPANPWRAGQYRIVIDTAIEDLAGNRIGRPFDVDVFDKVTQKIATKTVSLPLKIR
jgi:hypothetical protein